MQISLSKFATFITGSLVIAVFVLTGYIFFTVFFNGEKPALVASVEAINPSLFGPKVQRAAGVLINKSQQIALTDKDIGFITKSTVYKNFTDVPSTVSISEERGRPDPFIPYAAP